VENKGLHLTEEMLEEYCFNRLLETTKAAVEEHLLVCPACQEALQSLDEYISLMKAATQGYQATPSSGSPERAANIRPGFAWNT
jgi:anti-sigma factor RsiW